MGVTVAVRGDNVLCDSGEYPQLRRRHNSLGDHLRDVRMPPSSPVGEYPVPELVSRQQNKSTPKVARDTFVLISECTHAQVFGGEASWGHTLQRAARCSRYGNCSTSWCIDGHPDRRQHRDRP